MTLVDVPALTLRNPWAHLIAHGEKRIENRTWMPPDSLFRLLIHAGKGWAPRDAWYPLSGDVDGVDTAAIVAVADLAHVCMASRWLGVNQCQCGKWAIAGHAHWQLMNVVALRDPVPCNGRQGLWRPTDDVLSAVGAQLGRVAS